MLYATHFYNAQTRKILIGFANMFSKLSVQRQDSSGNLLHQERVPISYSPKAKFIQRLVQDINTNKEISIKLPRIAFEMGGLSYAPERKISTKNKIRYQDGNTKRTWSYAPVPYDVDFELSIYAKTQTEALQIVEQIIPFFTPDYTVPIRLLDGQTESFDIPFSLVSVNPDDQYEGSFEENRVIIWTLNFVAKAMFFGPLRTSDKIRAVLTNYYDFDNQTLMFTDVVYGSSSEDITQIMDYDGISAIPGTETPASPSESSPNVITLTQGSALSESLQLIDSDEDPVDLTGATIRGWIRRNLSSGDFRDLTVAISGDPENGQISLSMSENDTSRLELGTHIYEVEIDFPDGSTDRGASGSVVVNQANIE